MDLSSSKRGARGVETHKKPCSVTSFKDAATGRDQNAHFCNRIGCRGRIKCTQNARIENLDKSKISKPSFHSSNGNGTTGKSSSGSSIITTAKKPCLDSKRKMSSQIKPYSSKSSVSCESSSSELVSSLSNPSGSRYQLDPMNKPKDLSMPKGGRSSVSSKIGPRKMFHHKSPPVSSVPSASSSSALGPYYRSNGTRSGLRNLKCNSVTDVVQPSSSSLVSGSVGKKATKKNSAGESSLSHRGRKITPPSPIDRHISPTSDSGIFISDSARSSPASRMRISSLQNGRRNSSSVRESALSYSDNGSPFSGSRFYRLSSSNGANPSSRMPLASSESGLMHLVNHDLWHRHSTDGIAELLLALETIEQDEELTHGQVLALETSLFLSGLNLYDQHWDLRLDIDNMSYEELLALEERMGTVSTPLSEEALSNCLRLSIYHATPSDVKITDSSSKDRDDTKCSICQEEYVTGDNIGKLVECQHEYHATCINQWLQLKNWCPMCKASAEPSQSAPSL